MLLLTLLEPLVDTRVIGPDAIKERVLNLKPIRVRKFDSGRRLYWLLTQSLHKRKSITDRGDSVLQPNPFRLTMNTPIFGNQHVNSISMKRREQLMINPVVRAD